jgi:hypothetical protein
LATRPARRRYDHVGTCLAQGEREASGRLGASDEVEAFGRPLQCADFTDRLADAIDARDRCDREQLVAVIDIFLRSPPG